MTDYYGDFAEDDTVLIPFNTFTSDDAQASATITNLAAADINVHKDGSLTQIVTDGATVIIDFDSITGNHLITIDTSVDAAYSTGSEYAVRIEGTTVDGATVNAWVGSFSIERAGGALAIVKLIQAAVITNAAGTDVAADIIALKTETALIVADTNELQSDDLPLLISNLDAVVDTVKSETALIVADTNELQGDDVPGLIATLDAVVDTVKAETALIVLDTNELQTDNLPGLIATAQSDLNIITGADGVNLLSATQSSIDAIETDTGTTLDGKLNTIDTVVDAIKVVTDIQTAISPSSLVDLVWDEVLSGGAHNVTNSSGRRIRLLQDSGAYDGGFLFIDTVAGDSVTGAVDYENYTVTNAGNSLTEAKTIATSIGSLHSYAFNPDSSWTLISAITNDYFLSKGATLLLGSQIVTGATIQGFSVTGICTATADYEFEDCDIGNVTMDNEGHFHSCGLEGTFTIGQAGQFMLVDCFGTTDSPWILDFAALGATVVHLFNFNGDVTATNMATGDVLHITGNGVITTATCTAGTIEHNGDFRYTDTGGNVTEIISDIHTEIDAILEDTVVIGALGAGLTDLGGMSTGMKAEVNVEAGTALTSYDPPTNAEMVARTPSAAELAYMVSNSATGVPVTFTNTGGSTTVAVLNQVDGAAASTVNGQYTGRLIVFIDGSLKGVVASIENYTGSNLQASITGIPTAPTTSHNARML